MLTTVRFLIVALPLLLFGLQANATIVRFETSLGDIDINLYDQDTVLTVGNFLSYVESDAYDSTIIHRLADGFIIQGGGFRYDGLNQNNTPEISAIETQPSVTNEPIFSNVRGTIAMAKLDGDPDSATSQWFFNLRNL